MEFHQVVRGRRMCRAYRPEPVDAEVLDRVLDAGRRAPAAGNTAGTTFVVLAGREQTDRYWDVALPLERRGTFRWPRLLDAPVLVLPLADPAAYVARYAEDDKAHTGLGVGADRWPTPYWLVDTSFAAMSMLLAAEDEGLGALFFGIFRDADSVLTALGVPDGLAPIGMIALGHPADDAGDQPGRSAARGLPALDDIVHRGGW